MSLNDITLLICIDKVHIEELKFSYKTWEKYKPELVQMKKLIIYDYEIHNKLNELNFINNVVFYPFKNKNYYDSQRSAMITSFFEGISQINTKYYLKIDTDCIAKNDNKDWITEFNDRDDYIFITNPWGYTKGIDRINNLEDWGDTVYPLNLYNRLNLPVDMKKNKVKHKRIISWLFLGNTHWTNYMSKLCWNGKYYKLPDPSQDTFLWYCADRIQAKYKRKNFKKFGFDHGRIEKFKRLSEDKRYKVHVGCGNKYHYGWENLKKEDLNIINESEWKEKFKINSIDVILAEHVLEYLNLENLLKTIANFHKYLNDNGFVRIAVPDGYHPNEEYINKVKPNGIGKSAHDHKQLFNYKNLTELFENNGFKADLLEYFDENGNFHNKKWKKEDGFIKRSSKYDKRNKDGKLNYTSLIIDFYKELKNEIN